MNELCPIHNVPKIKSRPARGPAGPNNPLICLQCEDDAFDTLMESPCPHGEASFGDCALCQDGEGDNEE